MAIVPSQRVALKMRSGQYLKYLLHGNSNSLTSACFFCWIKKGSENHLQCSAHMVSSYFTSLDPGQRICRRGTERPCYKVSYIQDSRRRLTFEDARQACKLDGGELLTIETEGEQRLVERFIAQLQAGDGDFWIGLRRNPQRHKPGTTSPGCPSQYYWLDGSKAKFRFLSSSLFLCSIMWFGCHRLQIYYHCVALSIISVKG